MTEKGARPLRLLFAEIGTLMVIRRMSDALDSVNRGLSSLHVLSRDQPLVHSKIGKSLLRVQD